MDPAKLSKNQLEDLLRKQPRADEGQPRAEPRQPRGKREPDPPPPPNNKKR